LLPSSSTNFVDWIDLRSANRVAPSLVFGFAPPLLPLGFGATTVRRSSVPPPSPLGFGATAVRRLAGLCRGLDPPPPPRFDWASPPSEIGSSATPIGAWLDLVSRSARLPRSGPAQLPQFGSARVFNSLFLASTPALVLSAL
jgi:hypothetical protein